MLVMKFGGTSVGSADAMRNTADLIQKSKAEHGDVVVVASGMGSKPIKVTDLLLNGSRAALIGDVELIDQTADQLRAIHNEAIFGLFEGAAERESIRTEIDSFISRFVELCKAIRVLGEISPRASDAIGGMGEQMSVRILAAYFNSIGVKAQAIDATDLIVTDDYFTAATPLIEQTNEKTKAFIHPLLEDDVIPIVTGFIAATEDGITTTLGRGGSDYSASILGRALEADEVWIWTDVDGVMTTDPRLVPNARSIPMLSYREISELAYYGAKVLHPRTMRPVMESRIPLRIKNTFNPDHSGSVVLNENAFEDKSLKAVTAIKNLSMITVEGRGMLGVPGVAARTFKAVADTQASVLMITQSSSEQSICFAVHEGPANQVIHSLEKEFEEEIRQRNIEKIWQHESVSILTAVGSGIQGAPEVAGRMFTAIGDRGVNIIAIAQGSSNCNISVVVLDDEVAAAVEAVHELIVAG